MSEKKIHLWLTMDGPEKGNNRFPATYKETPLGWLIQYEDQDGFSIILAKRQDNIHLIKKGEWTIKAKYSLGETTVMSVESAEGNLQFALTTVHIDFKKDAVQWAYALEGQEDEFHFSYRWENVNESN